MAPLPGALHLSGTNGALPQPYPYINMTTSFDTLAQLGSLLRDALPITACQLMYMQST